MAVVSCETHIINDLKVKMLINMNILASEDIIINLSKKIAVIDNCGNLEVLLIINIKLVNQIS